MLKQNKMLLSERDEKLQTPLHIAIRNGKVKLAIALLESGANIFTRDLNGNSCYDLVQQSDLFDLQLAIEQYK